MGDQLSSKPLVRAPAPRQRRLAAGAAGIGVALTGPVWAWLAVGFGMVANGDSNRRISGGDAFGYGFLFLSLAAIFPAIALGSYLLLRYRRMTVTRAALLAELVAVAAAGTVVLLLWAHGGTGDEPYSAT